MRLRRGKHQPPRPVLVHVILALLGAAIVLTWLAAQPGDVTLGPLLP